MLKEVMIMKKTDKQSRFANFLFLLALHSMLQTPTQAMEQDEQDCKKVFFKHPEKSEQEFLEIINFKEVAEYHFRAGNYFQSAKLWEKYRQSMRERVLTYDEAKKVAEAYRKAEKLQKEADFRLIIAGSSDHTDEDSLDYAEVLLKLKRDQGVDPLHKGIDPVLICVRLMQTEVDSLTIYNRAYNLLKTYEPVVLEQLMNRQKKNGE